MLGAIPPEQILTGICGTGYIIGIVVSYKLWGCLNQIQAGCDTILERCKAVESKTGKLNSYFTRLHLKKVRNGLEETQYGLAQASEDLTGVKSGLTQAVEAWEEIPGLMRETFKMPPPPPMFDPEFKQLYIEMINQDAAKKAQALKTDDLERKL